MEVGRLCVKLAGRDAGRECLVVEKIDKNYVLIDGLTRRRKCNIVHLEMLSKTAKIKAKASHEEVMKALAEFGIEAPKAFARKKDRKPKAKAAPKKAGKGLLGGLIKTEEKPKPKPAAKKAPAKKPVAKKASAKKK